MVPMNYDPSLKVDAMWGAKEFRAGENSVSENFFPFSPKPISYFRIIFETLKWRMAKKFLFRNNIFKRIQEFGNSLHICRKQFEIYWHLFSRKKGARTFAKKKGQSDISREKMDKDFFSIRNSEKSRAFLSEK